MRERGTRQVYCVVCDLPIGPLPPPDQQPSAAEAEGSTPAAPPTPTAAAAAAAAALVEPREQPAAAGGGTSQQHAAGARTAPPATRAAANSVPAPAPAPATSPLSLSVGQALAGAQSALSCKVREVSALLSSTPVEEGSVERLRGYTQLLTECLGALQQVRQQQQQQ